MVSSAANAKCSWTISIPNTRHVTAIVRVSGKTCVGAWEENDDDCLVQHDMTCEQTLDSSDAICQCSPDIGACTACTAGTYKNENGSAACMLCSRGKYSTAAAAIAEATCSDCPAHTSSVLGSGLLTQCICNVGYTGPDGGTCVACVAGKFKTSNGSAPCTECSPGKFSTGTGVASETTCADCPANAYSGPGSAVCTCIKGYTGPDGGVCTACISGTYKDVNGSSPCTLCSPGKYSMETGGMLESTCDACPAHTHSPAGSASIMGCICNQGYTGADGALSLASLLFFSKPLLTDRGREGERKQGIEE